MDPLWKELCDTRCVFNPRHFESFNNILFKRNIRTHVFSDAEKQICIEGIVQKSSKNKDDT